jgi:hypothetical protein
MMPGFSFHFISFISFIMALLVKGCSTWRGSGNGKERSKRDSKCERKCEPCSRLKEQRDNATSF